MSEQEALSQLDYALFRNVYNMLYDEDRYQITFEGDNYVVWDMDENELYHFVVEIRPEAWDSTQARADQEWDI